MTLRIIHAAAVIFIGVLALTAPTAASAAPPKEAVTTAWTPEAMAVPLAAALKPFDPGCIMINPPARA
ncbi:hypothetical protein [Streptomyces sp. CA-253872]|uniref:hypothetical protein n=1 Tax=Streptomyces sp. CA-253872 TaxID=3240067 RepID=UPI003D8C21E4